MKAGRGISSAIIAALLGTAAAFVLASASLANDHQPPETTLQVEGYEGTQRGSEYLSFWTTGQPLPDGGMGCVTQSSDAPIWFPPPLRVLPGRHSASIILHKRERPDQLSIAAWRRVDQHGFPKGDSEEIPFALVPQAEDGQVANWRADFAADVRRHFYFRVFGVWRDSEGCGEIQQDAAWSFHLASATCRGIDATIVGTSNDDVTRGTPGPDVIVGSPRGDVISGMSGADLICSYEGNDRLLGNPGNDDLLGGRGRDELDGNQGRDRCQGGAGPDHLLNCEREGA